MTRQLEPSNSRQRGDILLVLAIAVSLAAHVAGGVTPGLQEQWETGAVSGWKRLDTLNGNPMSMDNPGTYLRILFAGQSMSLPEVDMIYADADSSGGWFVGDLGGAGITNIRFKVYCVSALPAQARLYVCNAQTGNEWYYPLESLVAGGWANYVIPMDYSAGWRLDSAPTQEKFQSDLQSVSRIGLRFQRNGSVSAQEYRLDDFVLVPAFGLIAGALAYSGEQQGGVVLLGASGSTDWSSDVGGTAPPAATQYQIVNAPPDRDYWVKGFVDANANGVYDWWEGNASWAGNPILGFLGRATGADLNMSDPKSAEGMPYWWLNRYFGVTGHTDAPYRFLDPDGDGQNNWAEYLAGTDPNAASSVFEADIGQTNATGGIVVRWKSVPVRTYTVWRTTDLKTPFGVLQAGIPSTPPVNVYVDSTAVGSGPYFYRVQVEQ